MAFALSGLGLANAQWSSDPGTNLNLIGESFYTYEPAYRKDGSFFLFYDTPKGEDTSKIIPFLLYFNEEGESIWDKPIQIADEPTLSYTKTMSHLMIDLDGNVIVAVQNLKNGRNETYTLYKIDTAGNFLWGRNGIDLQSQENGASTSPGALKMFQLADGSYIFAWMDIEGIFNNIWLQKISKDGEYIWGEGKNMGAGDYPYVVDGGDGNLILVYSYGRIFARKLDFDGNDLWPEPVLVFDGNLPELIPLWTYIQVVPANGGVLVGVYGFDGNSAHYPYMSYIKPDGSHGFPDAEAGLRLCFNENWGFEPVIAFDENNAAVYAIWRENAPGTNFVSRFCSQKISLEGELLWNPEGVELLPLQNRALGYPQVSLGPDNTVLFGFMEHKGNGVAANDPIAVHAVLQNTDGNFVWNTTTKIVSDVESVKYDLSVSPYQNGQWIFMWEDGRDGGGASGGSLYAQNLRADGSMGEPSAIESRERADASLQVWPNPVKTSTTIGYINPGRFIQDARISLLDLKGSVTAEVYKGSLYAGKNLIVWNRPSNLADGIYILKLESSERTVHTKVVLQ